MIHVNRDQELLLQLLIYFKLICFLFFFFIISFMTRVWLGIDSLLAQRDGFLAVCQVWPQMGHIWNFWRFFFKSPRFIPFLTNLTHFWPKSEKKSQSELVTLRKLPFDALKIAKKLDILFPQKMNIFGNFFGEKMSSFWQFLDSQMSIFRRVRWTCHCVC